MIYVSSSCINNKSIDQTIEILVGWGINSIELSGGTEYIQNLRQVLSKWKKRGVHFIVHNYFPPPESPFVFNIGALDSTTHLASIQHAIKAIEINHFLGSRKISFHAPFILDIPAEYLGQKFPKYPLLPREEVYERFVSLLSVIKEYAHIFSSKVYIENNVYSAKNYENYGGDIPFMLTRAEEYLAIQKDIEFPILLDIAHLKVSCHTLGLDFEEQLRILFPLTDYIHISDNNGLEDQNKSFDRESHLFKVLSKFDWHGKTVTLETYEDKNGILSSLEAVKLLLNGN